MNWQQLPLFVGLTVSLGLLPGCDQAPQEKPTKPTSDAISADTKIIGKLRPEFSLPDLEGKMRNIKEWDNKVLVINFWATWCPPCRKEMPAFIELQEQYGEQGLQFIGVAIDTPDAVTDFSDTYGINYPMMVGELEAIEIGKKYGNRFGALPYTVITDRSGKIVFVQRGELLKETAENTIKPLL